MSTETYYDVGAPTIEVRIYDHGPDDILASEEPSWSRDDVCPIASAPPPGYGTE